MSENSTFEALRASALCRALGSCLLCLMGNPPLCLKNSRAYSLLAMKFVMRKLKYLLTLELNTDTIILTQHDSKPCPAILTLSVQKENS